MAASWIAHVKETHKKNGGSYKDALKAASKTWKKKGAAAKPAKKARKGKKADVEEEEVDEKEEAPAPKRRRKKKAKSKSQPIDGPGPLVPKRRPGVPKGYKNIN